MTVRAAKRGGKPLEGKYDIRICVPDARGKSKRIEVRIDAESMSEALEYEKHLKREYNVKIKTGNTIAVIWGHYRDHLMTNCKSAKTIKDKEQCFNVRLLPFFGNMLPEKIDAQMVEQFKKHRLEQSPGRFRQINKELVYLSAMINWAADPRVQLTAEKSNQYFQFQYKPKARKALTKAQVEALMDAADLKHKAIFGLMCYGGLRITEVLELKWEKVIFAAKYIVVLGKGNKERIVPMPEKLFNILAEYKTKVLSPPDVSKYGEKYVKRRDIMFRWNNFISRYAPSGSLTGGEWVFPNYLNPEQHLTDIKTAIHATAERAEIGMWVTPHMLRHSYATMLLTQGASTRAIQALLGHEQITTTERYAHVVPDLLRQSVDKL